MGPSVPVPDLRVLPSLPLGGPDLLRDRVWADAREEVLGDEVVDAVGAHVAEVAPLGSAHRRDGRVIAGVMPICTYATAEPQIFVEGVARAVEETPLGH